MDVITNPWSFALFLSWTIFRDISHYYDECERRTRFLEKYVDNEIRRISEKAKVPWSGSPHNAEIMVYSIIIRVISTLPGISILPPRNDWEGWIEIPGKVEITLMIDI